MPAQKRSLMDTLDDIPTEHVEAENDGTPKKPTTKSESGSPNKKTTVAGIDRMLSPRAMYLSMLLEAGLKSADKKQIQAAVGHPAYLADG
jgi:hypothetical protein